MIITNFLKPTISLFNLFKLFEDWNVDRGADGAENGFDLQDYADFHLFANLYGLETALKCQAENPYWIGGLNFPKPIKFPQYYSEAKEFIEKSIDIDTILNRPDIYEKYFVMDEIYKAMYKDRYKPNMEVKKDLEYPVVLQHFTIVIWRMYTDNVDCFDEDMTEDDVMDMAANLAWDFTELYKRTAWETTFRDYMLHFIVLNLRLHNVKYFEHALFHQKFNCERLIQSVINQGGYFGDNQ